MHFRFACTTTFLFVASLLMAPAAVLRAEELTGPVTKPRSQLSVAAFFAEASTKMRVDAQDGTIGTALSLEDNLNVDDEKTLPSVDYQYRFANPKHRLEFSFFKLDRSGTTVLQQDVQFQDILFPAGSGVSTFFDTDVLRASYGYSFLYSERGEFGLMVGLHVTRLNTGIETILGTLAEDVSVTGPLPVIGIQGNYDLGGGFSFGGRAQIFRLDINNISGAITHYAVTLEHQTFERFGLGLAYAFFEIDVDVSKKSAHGNFDFEYMGPSIYLYTKF